MKNTRIVILYYKLSFLILFLLLKSALLLATEDVIYNLKFKQLSAPYFLPTNEVQKVYQDKDGFIWFATRNGLCQYNGYETTLYKSNLYSPDLLTTNSITCLVDDNNNHLLIHLPYFLDGLDSAESRHMDVHKCNIRVKALRHLHNTSAGLDTPYIAFTSKAGGNDLLKGLQHNSLIICQ